MDPGQLPGDPETGLVEVRDLSPDRALTTSSRDGAIISAIFLVIPASAAGGRRAAEHLRHRPTGPVPGQELPGPQVHAQRCGPYFTGAVTPPAAAPGHRPATAPPADHLVLGDLCLHRRDIRHLPTDDPRLRRPGKVTVAPDAAGRLVPDHRSG